MKLKNTIKLKAKQFKDFCSERKGHSDQNENLVSFKPLQQHF